MIMKESIKRGFSFGLTSGIITTIGIIVGLGYATNSKPIIIGGILTVAIADAFSDALGIHISEESQKGITKKQIWESTFSTYLSKLFFALLFIIPFLFFEIKTSIYIGIIYGIAMLGILSFFIAKEKRIKPLKVITEHISIAIIVIIITYYIGISINKIFIS